VDVIAIQQHADRARNDALPFPNGKLTHGVILSRRILARDQREGLPTRRR
jgi:hypothetical protein